jgi:hypothetical protein
MSGITSRTVCCNEISSHNRLQAQERQAFAPLLAFRSQYFERNTCTLTRLGDAELEQEERRFGQIVSHLEKSLFIPSHETEHLIMEIRAAFAYAKQQKLEAAVSQFVDTLIDQALHAFPKKEF